APITGMMMSPTRDCTIAPKATPMITPIARSTTLPRMANSRNSLSMIPSRHQSTRTVSRILVDEAGMHHGVAHRGLGLFRKRHHRQPHGVGALAQHRERILRRRRIGLNEQVLMQRHQL